MIIGVDAGCLGIKDKRLRVGVYQVARNLLQQLAQIDKHNRYNLYSFYPIEKKLLKDFGPRAKNIIVRPSRGWLKLWLPLQLIKDKPDVFLALGQSLPLQFPFQKSYIIGFVYDLAFEKYPDLYPDSFERLQRNTRYLTSNADHVIAISEATKRDLVKLHAIVPEKITVAYPAFIERRKKRRKLLSREPYFLFVGSLKKSKNIPAIIRGFSHFIEKTKAGYMLYIVGGDKWFDEDISAALLSASEHTRKKIKLLGHAKKEIVESLYRGATAFVSPSFYEGFGLTFLEAMSFGCPVIGSKRGSIPEIVGDAGILVKADAYKAIGDAMIKISNNKELRNMYVQKGLQRSKEMLKENFGEKVYQVIKAYEKQTN